MTNVRYKIFGGEHHPTIYYLTGYGGKINLFRPHLFALSLGGFRIVAFEYDKSILQSGDPKYILDVLKEIERVVNHDKKERKVAGIYGVSLGSWLGLNVAIHCNIKKGMFNTGAVSLSRTIWKAPRLKAEKAAFQKHGHTLASLEEIWGKYDFNADGRRYVNHQLVVMSSTTDEIMDIKEVRQNVAGWQKDNPDVELITTGRLRHAPAIGRHMLRLRKTLRFFAKTKKQKQEVVSYPTRNRRG